MVTRKKNWYDRLKRFFSSENKSKQAEKVLYFQKERKKRWMLGRLRSKWPPSLPALRSVKEVEQDVATAVAAEEVAVAAGHTSAAQVVRLSATPSNHWDEELVAAIKIQSSFRGYLARRALQALKGLVKLQALIRGQAVRHQTTITLKGLQSLMKIQTQACASRMRVVYDRQANEGRDIIYMKTEGSPLRPSSERRWDSSSFSKEEIIASLSNRREAAIKRERAVEYAYSHQDRRIPTTPVSDVEEQRWSWLDQWIGTQPLDKGMPKIFPTPCRVADQNSKQKLEETQLRYLARRSFNHTRASITDDASFTSSPSLPSYMACTASTKARFRSSSTPKQRLGTVDSCSDHCAPYTNTLLSPFPFTASQRSPQLRGRRVCMKSERSSNHLSFDSECSLLNWDRRNAFT